MGSRLKLLFSLIVLSVLTACATSAGEPTADPLETLVWEACQISSQGMTLNDPARCTRLAVPEDPSNPSGRQIELNIAIISAVSRNPAPDPIFFIPGGPGEAATESFVSVAGAFDGIRQKRDIVLVDQRGTGSSHRLECELPGEDSTDEVDVYLRSCLDSLDADPRYYTTSIAMHDLDLVRQALGYQQVNLYGASYGTRAALEYMRLYPQSVRTAVLDGVAPPQWALGPDAPEDAQAALEALFERCASRPECSLAFPDLPAEFAALLEKFASGPISVRMDDPKTSQPITYELSRDQFVNTIHLMSYTPETAALLPLLIHTTFSRDDFSRLAAIVQSNETSLIESLSLGMRYSVMCAEDVPFYPDSPVTAGYLGDGLLDGFEEICATWPRGELPAGYKDPVRSDAPTLLISGENDPATPPHNGDLAAESLPNSLHLVVPGMGHVNVYRGCIPRLVETLVDAGTVAGLDTTCVSEIQPPPFFINFNGPKP